ncbi:S-protein homolog 1-like [Mercurialis annua]|uniref:S-protein homolog 1-like n=1 Tax=Mercurialis annua TaxID=3986 RepID=UPI00215F6005|nr:S-protein homolog 1-like [Mercurialis annua]
MSMKILFIFVLAMNLFPKPNNSKIFPKYYVHIVNELRQNQDLFIHCKSADNDLGRHNLLKGQEFGWSFRLNFFGTTLFWCNLAPNERCSAKLVVFQNSQYLFDRCGYEQRCIWIARDDGVYLRNNAMKIDEFQRRWESATLKPCYNMLAVSA